MIIAVDGPAAAGKGTLARALADAYGLAYLDTGLIYRGVAKAVLDAEADPADPVAAAENAKGFRPGLHPDAALRTPAVARAASVVARHAGVRDAVLDMQRAFAFDPPGDARGAVLDGRDIGTVVLPDADVKFFITASVDARADRRFREMAIVNERITLQSVRADLEERDRRDRERAVAPLKPADDAHLIDTSDLSIDEAFAAARRLVDAARRS